MKKRTAILFISLVFLVSGFILSFPVLTDEGTAGLPGITSKDSTPNGCIDCHTNKGASGDSRLNMLLKKNENHIDITAIVKTVPKDCYMCHKEGTETGSLSLTTHKSHYENPMDNDFLVKDGGSCLSCHALNPATGDMTVKNASKNW